MDFKRIATAGMVVLALGAVTLFVLSAANYIAFEGFVEHTTANTVDMAWRYVLGQPLYRAYDEGAVLISAYGPLLFLFNALALSVFDPSFVVVKMVAITAAALSVVVVALSLKRRFAWNQAALGVFVYASALVMAGIVPLWDRPEPFLLLVVALGLCVARMAEGESRKWGAMTAVAVLVGVAVNFKVTAFVYLVPIAVAGFLGGWYWRWPLMAVIAVAAFLAVFLIPGVPLDAYLAGVFGVAGERTIDAKLLKSALKFSLTYLSPLIVVVAALIVTGVRGLGRELLYVASYVAVVLVLIYPAAVPGAGWYHFVPLLPITVDILVRFTARLNEAPRLRLGAMALFVVGFAILAVPPFGRLNRAFAERTWAPVLSADIRTALETYAGERIELGYGEDIATTYHYSFHRPLLLFAGQTSTVDAMTEMEMAWRGHAMPESRLAALRNCATTVWLIPKDERPFVLRNYFGGTPIFSEAWLNTFHESYEKVDSLQTVDVWRCRSVE